MQIRIRQRELRFEVSDDRPIRTVIGPDSREYTHRGRLSVPVASGCLSLATAGREWRWWQEAQVN